MKLFWFIYSAFMCVPAALAAFVYYKIMQDGSAIFCEPVTVIRIFETICAFTFALLAVAGWIVASIFYVKEDSEIDKAAKAARELAYSWLTSEWKEMDNDTATYCRKDIEEYFGEALAKKEKKID